MKHAEYNQCPVCGHPGRFVHYFWPKACRQCGTKLLFNSGNSLIQFLKQWAALPVIFLFVEKKPPIWLGALTGIGIFLLVNIFLWLVCRLSGRPDWYSGHLECVKPTQGMDFSGIQWKKIAVLFLCVLAAIVLFVVLAQWGLSYSPIGDRRGY